MLRTRSVFVILNLKQEKCPISEIERGEGIFTRIYTDNSEITHDGI